MANNCLLTFCTNTLITSGIGRVLKIWKHEYASSRNQICIRGQLVRGQDQSQTSL